MKRLSMMSLTLALSVCIAPAWADDDEGKKNKKRKSTKPVIVSTVEIVDEEDGESKTTKSGTIIIDINGEKKEFKIGEKDDPKTIAVKIDDLLNGGQPKAIAVKIDELIDKADLDKQIEALFIGQGMIVGPDGEKKEFKFGSDTIPADTLKDLPEEVRKRVQDAMKGLGKDSMLGQAIMISPDGGKKIIRLGDNSKFDEVLKDLPADARKKVEEALKGVSSLSMKSENGRAIVISPDGAKNEFTFDGLMTGDDVDLEVIKGLPGTLQYRIRRSVDKTEGDKATSAKSATQDALSKKLDIILKRLDKIEQELKDMRQEEL